MDKLLAGGLEKITRNTQLMMAATVVLVGLAATVQTQEAQAFDLGGTTIGAVAGGLVGNQIGNGNGKTAATALGTLVGGMTGNAVAQNMDGNTANGAFRSNGGNPYPDARYSNPPPRYDQPSPQYNNPQPNGSQPASLTGTAIGAVAGGILGNQVGGGNGKKAAALLGAIVGGMTGNAVAQNMDGNTGAPGNNTGYRGADNYRGGEMLQYNLAGRQYIIRNGAQNLDTSDVRYQGLMAKVDSAVQSRVEFEGRRQAAIFGQPGGSSNGLSDYEWKGRATGVMDNLQTAAQDYNINVRPFVFALSEGLRTGRTPSAGQGNNNYSMNR